ncbi:uncharacterized protein LOC126663922 [Mercurialis annua]|uniref:uncharacterized protein LOC126663922 n=1 Tax=Mercurialis annua TaxID=3986 RepID=UPI00215F7160|nr:uncharacterized protein LOC126663922 [Mercurialis annua]
MGSPFARCLLLSPTAVSLHFSSYINPFKKILWKNLFAYLISFSLHLCFSDFISSAFSDYLPAFAFCCRGWFLFTLLIVLLPFFQTSIAASISSSGDEDSELARLLPSIFFSSSSIHSLFLSSETWFSGYAKMGSQQRALIHFMPLV